MRLTPIALLVVAALPDAYGPSTSPDLRDVTITTRRTISRPHTVSQVRTLQIKGPRRRTSFTFERAGLASAAGIHITQCDLAREIAVNDRAALYAISPIPASRGPSHDAAADTRPLGETVTVDAVDTGERRTVGPFTARRVVTTTTTERAGQRDPVSTRVQDGWYLDLPSQCGDAHGAGATMLIAGSVSVRTEVKWKGTARSGWAVAETDTTIDQYHRSVATTALVELSTAALDSALFEVPHGYRPALPLRHGGFDLEKPDTVVNRVRDAVESAASWVHYTWSRLTSPGPAARFTAQ